MHAGAQPVARADVTAVLAWLNANKSGLSDYNDWYNRSAYGGASVGWFWTDHLKTELDFGASSPAELYATKELEIDGVHTYTASEYRFSTRRIAVNQQYQFLRNVWVHPHAGVGVDVTWERTEREDAAGIRLRSADPHDAARSRPAFTAPVTTRVLYRPFAEDRVQGLHEPAGVLSRRHEDGVSQRGRRSAVPLRRWRRPRHIVIVHAPLIRTGGNV